MIVDNYFEIPTSTSRVVFRKNNSFVSKSKIQGTNVYFPRNVLINIYDMQLTNPEAICKGILS